MATTAPNSSNQPQQNEETNVSRLLANILSEAGITDPEVIKQLQFDPSNRPAPEDDWSLAPKKYEPVGSAMSQYQAGKLAKKVMDLTANISKVEVSLHNEQKHREGDAHHLAYLERQIAKREAILQHQDACSTSGSAHS